MKKTIKYLESLFAVEGDSYSPAEREAHNKAIQQAIDSLIAVDAADTAFEMIRIHGYDEKLSPQAVKAINEAFPLVRIARFGKDAVDFNPQNKYNLLLLRFDKETNQPISGTYNGEEIEDYNAGERKLPEHICEIIRQSNII